MTDPTKALADAARKVISIGLEEQRLTCPTRPVISILRDRMVRIRELLIPAMAAYVAAAAAARSSTLNACADIVRKHYPHPPTENANG